MMLNSAAAKIFSDTLYTYVTRRGYHNWRHITQCLDQLRGYGHLADDEEALWYALFFHDAIYEIDAEKGMNEKLSAEMASVYLTKLGRGAQREWRQKVQRLILATIHDKPGETSDERLMQDIDLLGFSSNAWAMNSTLIREEFREVPDEVYLPERLKVLNWFLDRDEIYHTPQIRAEHEEKARHNIKTEIDYITARIGAISSDG